MSATLKGFYGSKPTKTNDGSNNPGDLPFYDYYRQLPDFSSVRCEH